MDLNRMQRGQQWLDHLLKLSGLSASAIAADEDVNADGSSWLTIDETLLTTEQIEILVGEQGVVLDAVQYLLNTTLNLGIPEEVRGAYTVELNGYRVRRQAELQALAEQAATQVRETGKEYEMASLSSAERRQVHTILKDFADLETYSRGQEPDRRLVVRLAEVESSD